MSQSAFDPKRTLGRAADHFEDLAEPHHLVTLLNRPFTANTDFGWLTPTAFARALTGQIGRSAALVDGCADRPLANPTNRSPDQPGTVLVAG
jgi:hypothetical protein